MAHTATKEDRDMDGWWDERSLGEKVVIGIILGILGIGALFGFIAIVMTVWNNIMPEIFGLKELTYWQTLGLIFLSCVFFQGIGGGSDSGSSKRKDRRRKSELRKFMEEAAEKDEKGEFSPVPSDEPSQDEESQDH